MVELVWDGRRNATVTTPSGEIIHVGEGAKLAPQDLLAAAAMSCLLQSFLQRHSALPHPLLSFMAAGRMHAGPTASLSMRVVVTTSRPVDPQTVSALLVEARAASPVCQVLGDRLVLECSSQSLPGGER